MTSFIGQRFGHYNLIKIIDQGGFAEVYLGRHIYLKTYAAIKVLKTHLVQGERSKFLQEARTIAFLEHPHIVRILDYGVKGSTPYLVMNYAPNGSLRKLHPRGEILSLDTVLTYLQQLAYALDYVHNQGFVHQDIKPENMLLGRNNEVLLSDFGIAVLARKASSMRRRDFTGTISYAAPERFRGWSSPASDQYSLGVVVYEWLTGERPFYGSRMQIAQQHLYASPPSLCTKCPTISPYVEQVVFKSLEKEPGRRFASIQDFVNALEQASNLSTFSMVAKSQPSLYQEFQILREFLRKLF